METRNKQHIEVFGRAEKRMCQGCGSDTHDCAPDTKVRVLDLFNQFGELLKNSGLDSDWSAEFIEATPENIARNADVQRLLSMAELDPVICLNGKISYLGGFSPEGLLNELKKLVER